jgi:hypothetical protein
MSLDPVADEVLEVGADLEVEPGPDPAAQGVEDARQPADAARAVFATWPSIPLRPVGDVAADLRRAAVDALDDELDVLLGRSPAAPIARASASISIWRSSARFARIARR